MDAKDLRTETALSERNNDGSKYSQSGVALQCNRNKTYQDIGSNPLGKAEPAAVRPCAVIGPDRVVPPPITNDVYLKKGSIEPWTCPDNMYPRPPDYPHKVATNHNPTRNISPRQTFQENMQRIMVPPSYNVKHNDDTSFTHVHERNPAMSKNAKPNMPSEGKYCEVPYAINPMTNEHKNLREPEMCVPSVNSPLTRTAPHVWPPGGINLHAPRAYGAHELYQYPQYPSCAGPRQSAMPMMRTHRYQDEPGYVYPEPFYQDPNVRFKPYPPVKERYPQPRYEYISNYTNPFHPPPPFPSHKYEMPKPGQPHPYPLYPHLKYVDNRLSEPSIEPYQRPSNAPPNYLPFRNQVLHSNYANSLGTAQNKVLPYPTDNTGKPIVPNKGPYDNNNKVYIDYENSRPKAYPPDTYFVNEMSRVHPSKAQGMMPPNYPGVHPMGQQQFYRKDIPHIKAHEYMPHFRNYDPSMNAYSVMRHPSQFSPNTLAISPTDSNASNDTSQTHGTNQEDCGYVSQSSTASVRSLDSGINRVSSDYYKRHDFRYTHALSSMPMHSKSDMNSSSKDKKQIDVRQFLQMWNEGDEENSENNGAKEIIIQTGTSNPNSKETSQEQLYVLGLVNVPSEELGKYEHIQKVSKLPENIKGYNNIELLNQFEEAIESAKVNPFKPPNHKEYHMSLKDTRHSITKQMIDVLPRPLSPLDVESKISQSVIHKEVGCNFEIKPCSPKMLNVEVAAPIQNILGERVIEKVTNPLSKIIKSPMPALVDENSLSNKKDLTLYDSPSCKMISSPFSRNPAEPVKTNYSLQDLETNSGVCLASLPRLDNELELTFPEVNQQFIDANKIENSLKSNSPIIQESPVTKSTDGNNKKNKEEIIHNKESVDDNTENEYFKLSKYRKVKGSNSIEPCEESPKLNTMRTDSVIIKNPENVKKYDDKNIDFTLKLEDVNEIPVNLSSQSFDAKVSHSNHNLELFDRPSVMEPMYSDGALDFSMNKADNYGPAVDPKKIHEIEPNLSSEDLCANKKDDVKSPVNKHTCLNMRSPKDAHLKMVEKDHSIDDNNFDSKIVSDINLEEMLNSVAEKVVSYTSSINLSQNMRAMKSFDSQCVEDYSIIKSNSDVGVTSKKIENNSEEMLLETSISKDKPIANFDNDLLNDNITDMIKQENTSECGESYSDSTKEDLGVTPENTDFDEHDSLETQECETIEEENIKIAEDNEDLSGCTNELVTESTTRETIEWSSPEFSNRLVYEERSKVASSETECDVDQSTLDSQINTDDNTNTLDGENKNCRREEQADSFHEIDSNVNMVNAMSVSDNDLAGTSMTSNIDTEFPTSDMINTVKDPEIESMTVNPFHILFPRKTLKKELNSPWVQKLLLHSEGLLYRPCDLNESNDLQSLITDSECDHKPSESSEKKEALNDGYEDCEEKSKCSNNDTKDLSDVTTNMEECSPMEVLLEEANCSPKNVENCTVEDNHNTKEIIAQINVQNDEHNPVLNNIVQEISEINKEALETKKSSLIFEASMEKSSICFEESFPPVSPLSPVSPLLESAIVDASNRTENDSFENTQLTIPDEKILIENNDQFIPVEKKSSIIDDDSKICEIDESIDQLISDEKKASNLENNSKITIDEMKNTIESIAEQKQSPILENNTEIEIDDIQNSIESVTEEKRSPILDDDYTIENIEKKDNDQSIPDAKQSPINNADIEIVKDELSILEEKRTCISDDNSRMLNKNTEQFDSNVQLSCIAGESSKIENDNTGIEKLPDQDSKESSKLDTQCEEMSHSEININDEQNIHIEDTNNDIECALEALETDPVLEPNSIIVEPSFNRGVDENDQVPDTECNNESIRLENKKTNEENKIYDDHFQRPRTSLKRSYSDSDLSSYNKDKNISSRWPSKRKRIDDTESLEQNIAENLCRLIQNNRRNSISTFQNEENVSFCILIEDNCILSEESNEEKICYAEFSEDCLTAIDSTNDEDIIAQVIPASEESNGEFSDSVLVECQDEDKSNDGEPWVDDIGCVETVVSDDVAEDVIISTSSTPEREEMPDYDESGIFCNSLTEHADKVKSIYGENLSEDDAQIVDTLFRTPQMDVNKTLILRKSMDQDVSNCIYDDDYLENMLSEPDDRILVSQAPDPKTNISVDMSVIKQDLCDGGISSFSNDDCIDRDINMKDEVLDTQYEPQGETQVDTVHSCESSVDNVFSYKHKDDDVIYSSSSSSPEVSSTTSEEKNSSILLKITNFNGSRVSEINEIKTENRPRCKFTEDKDYSKSNVNFPNRPLLTKAAQKYIPPIKETIRDLKVQISLPQQSLLKLKQLKLSKHGPKIVNKKSSVVPLIPKKPKPNFEDVLKSIDEIQFKKHKEKTKKPKTSIPKVVIKKNENGSHYASTSSKDSYNPDLTGRKWQPWVFLEKNIFIDKMALRNKTRAIYSHRKNTYVLAEKFKKYKSISSAKFVITQPKSSECTGHLKYTIRLKHSY